MSFSDLSSVSRLRPVVTRSISAENPTGAAGQGGRATDGVGATAARDLGQGWKISPAVEIPVNSIYTVAAIDGPGRITHIWMTVDSHLWRTLVLRMYWDGDERPAVEVPLGDFFAQGGQSFAQVNSIPISANPLGGLNSYWPMPFRTGARITIENIGTTVVTLFYQVSYEVGGDTEMQGYFHAQFRRTNPVLKGGPHLILEGVEGQGHYVGTYMFWESHSPNWWGEGEIKFYMDDDQDFPTICGTGTEDYFGGAWGFYSNDRTRYVEYSTPYLGMPQVLRADGFNATVTRFGLYRWHVLDPIHFAERLGRVDIQALGWRSAGRFMQLQDDIASTAVFYLDRTSTNRPPTPTADEPEVITPIEPALMQLGTLPPEVTNQVFGGGADA